MYHNQKHNTMATKTTFRHIGYYNEDEDIKTLFCTNANNVVASMQANLGTFHPTKGDATDDIDYNEAFKLNPSEYQMTSDGKYLVRFERGDNNNEDWFIDIFIKTEIKEEDTNDSNKVYEYCPHCESEVELANEFKVQVCPECGKAIVPCSICPFQPYKCSNNCPLEALCKQLNNESEM